MFVEVGLFTRISIRTLSQLENELNVVLLPSLTVLEPNQTKPHSDNKEKSSLKQVCSSILGSISHPSMHSSQLGYYAKWVGDETKNVWKVFGSSISPQARSAFWRCTTITIFVLSLYICLSSHRWKQLLNRCFTSQQTSLFLFFLFLFTFFFTIKLL